MERRGDPTLSARSQNGGVARVCCCKVGLEPLRQKRERLHDQELRPRFVAPRPADRDSVTLLVTAETH